MTDNPMTRREWVASLARLAAGSSALAVLATLRPSPLSAGAARPIVVYKDANCGCCKEWVTHLKQSGFAPVAHDRTDMDALKDSLGVPAALRSCHTGVVGKFVIEGHVPAADIVRLLTKKPKGITGLAVPGMPAGSPGMEMGGRRDRYDVMAFSANGVAKVFATHG
jgi:hypothetical protein